MEKKPYFFIPVEITNRELDYKINIARYFLHAGFKIIFGNPAYLRDELKYKNYKGIFLEKGVNPTPEYYQHLQEKGIFLYDLSDEGLGNCVYSITHKPILDTLSNIRKIFFWGNFQKKEIYERCACYLIKKKMHTIGNPAFDLSSPKYKGMNVFLKQKNIPSDYILVNMNFSSLFGHSTNANIEACSNMSPQTRGLIAEACKSESMQWPIFQAWLEKIIKFFPNETFLIRPHPAEIQKNYEIIFEKYKNVVVSKEGNVNYVIASAKLVLHKDCSTAMQSYLMGIPSISLGGELSRKEYMQWPLNFSALPENTDETRGMIEHILKTGNFCDNLQPEIDKRAKDILDKYFFNLGCSTKALVDAIIEDSEALIKNMSPYKIIDTRSLFQRLKLFFRKKMPLHYKVPKAACETLVEFSKIDVTKRLNLLESIDPLNPEYHVKKVFPNAFEISVK